MTPDSALLGRSLAAQAEALVALGRADEAERAAKEAVPFAERRPADLPYALSELGLALAARGDALGALQACERAIAMQADHDPPSPTAVYDVDPRRCAGEAELSLGEVERARAHLEASATFSRRPFAGDLALTRFALARALTPIDPPRARALAEEARGELLAAVRVRGLARAGARGGRRVAGAVTVAAGRSSGRRRRCSRWRSSAQGRAW